MGNRCGPSVTNLWPTRVQTVGQMIEHDAMVCAYCPRCRNFFKVDLAAIIYTKGRSYSLIDQRGPCRLRDCEGRALFMWSPGENVPWRPLATEAGSNARMFGDTQVAPIKPDDEPDPPPPPAPLGVNPAAWAAADDLERKRLIRIARG